MSATVIPRGKLAPPETAFEPLLPHALQVLLRSAVLAKLVVVCAPPGYGKTTLLAQLHRTLQQREVRCAWLTLDDRDTSVASLLNWMSAALQERIAGAAPADGLDAPAAPTMPDDPRERAERLLTHIATLDSATVLFIDNLQMCTDAQLAPMLERLVFGSGRMLRLVLSSTEDLPLDTTRAKLELSTVEVRAPHLALDIECLRGLLQQAGLADPPRPMLQRMLEQTEGWPAAARLLQVLMSQDVAPDDVALRFSGTDHDIAQVLTRRVLAGFAPRRVAFLMELALVREFSAEFAASITGCDEAGEWLDDLLRRNILIFPLDRSHRWLRMHTLLRQYLLAEGARRLPRGRRQEVLERAARWQADRGDDVAALEAALAAPAPTLAGQLLDRVAKSVAANQGQLAHYAGWVEQLLSTGVTLSPEAHAWYVWSLCFSLQYERAYSALESLDHRLAEVDPGGERAASLRTRVSLLHVVIGVHLDMIDRARDEAQRWLTQAGDRDALGVATVSTAAAVAELTHGRLGTARQFMQAASSAVARSDSAYGQGWVASVQACVDLADGDPTAADLVLSQERPRVVRAVGERAAIVSTMDFVHARALLDLGREAAAREMALRGLAMANVHGVNETAHHGLTACVGLWDGSADSAFAPQALDPVVRCYAPRTQRAVAVQQVRRLLFLGAVDEARDFAHRQALDMPWPEIGDDQGDPERVLLDLEMALAAGHGRDALQRIERHQKAAHSAQRWRDLLHLHLLATEAWLRCGDVQHAQRTLGLAVFVAARRRLLQPLLERAPRLRPILSKASTKDFGMVRPEELELLERLREASGATVPEAVPAVASASGPDTGAAAADPLTRRELELLELLSQGLSNQQIADRVSLSVPTIKWHFYNLYAKLQVKSRAAALAKARSLLLLSR